MKNVNIFGVHQFSEGVGSQKTIYMWNCLKGGGLGQFAGGLAKNREEGVFERGLIPWCTLWLNSGTSRNLR